MSPSPDRFAAVPGYGVIRGRMARMWLITAASRGGGQLIHLVALVVLARLLVPEDFGLIAMVMAVVGIASIFGDLGLSAATIRAPEITSRQASSLLFINVGFGLLMTGLVAASAPLLASLYGDPRVLKVTLVLSLTFALSGLAAQHSALLRRQLKFGVLAWINIIAMAAGQGLAVVMALQGFGYWALVAAMLITQLMKTLMVWFANPWRPERPEFDKKVRRMISFGGYLVLFTIMGYIAKNIHSVLIGWQYGAVDVGYFSRAFALITLFISFVLSPLSIVAPAALARMTGEPARYSETYLHTVAMMLLLAAPIGFFCMVAARDIIVLLLGGQWNESAVILTILAASVVPQVLCASSGWLYLSHGDSRMMMLWGVFGYGALIIFIAIGTLFGIRGVAIAYSVGMFVLLYPCMVMAFRRTTIRFLDLMRTAAPIVSAALVAVLPLLLLQRELEQWSLMTRVPLLLALYGGAYLLLLVTISGQRGLLVDVLRQLEGKHAA